MKRINKMLKYLIQSKKFVKIEELSDKFNISQRTAREDLSLIEDYLSDNNISFKRNRKEGIFIDTNNMKNNQIFDLIKNINDDANYYSDEERFKIILQTLFLAEDNITFDYLSQKMLVSKTTVVKDISNVQKWLEENNIILERKPHYGIKITCDESAWRKAVLEYLIPNLKDVDLQSWINSNYSVLLIFDPIIDEFIFNFISGTIPVLVSNFIHKYESDFNIKFSDNSYITLLLYISISLSRIKNNKELSVFSKDEFNLQKSQTDWLNENKSILLDSLDFSINQYELDVMVLYLSSVQKYFKDYSDFNEIGIFDCKQIVLKFIKNVENILNIEFSVDDALYKNLLMHISPAIHRVIYNVSFNNSLKEEIKYLYPEIFNSCKRSMAFFEKIIGKEINDDEISLLAMHIGAAVEKIRKKDVSLNFCKVLVVCADGVGASYLLCSRLLKEFANLIIEDVIAADELSGVNLNDIDMIITTIPLFININVPIIKVSPLLRQEDILFIKKEIKKKSFENKGEQVNSLIVKDLMNIVVGEVSEVNYDSLKEKFEKYFNSSFIDKDAESEGIKKFLLPELIELNVDVCGVNEAIKKGGELLLNGSYIESIYIDKMIQIFEDMGNYISIADGVVMPHGKPSDGVLKTGFSFVVLKEPIVFDEEDEPVSLVITLAADDSMTHLKAIKDLSHVLDDDFLKEIKTVQTKDEFINCIEKRL